MNYHSKKYTDQKSDERIAEGHKNILESTSDKIKFMRSELSKADTDYTELIEKCRNKLEIIDNKLNAENDAV